MSRMIDVEDAEEDLAVLIVEMFKLMRYTSRSRGMMLSQDFICDSRPRRAC